MKTPLVSIIIPVYNCEKYLSRCLESVINQTYRNIEILLINDGSTDNSEKICIFYKKKDSRIKYYKKNNSGVSATRNFGIKKIVGEYLMFIDSDDTIAKKCIERCIDITLRYKCDILKFNYNIFTKIISKKKKNKFKKNSLIYFKHYNKYIFPFLFQDDTFCQCWGCLYNAKLILKNKIFFDENINYGEDFLFFITCLCNSKSLYFLNEYNYNYNLKIIGTTKKYNIKKSIKFIEDGIISSKKIENMIYKKYKIRVNSEPKIIRNILGLTKRCIEQSNYKEYILFIDTMINNELISNEINKKYNEYFTLIKKRSFFYKYKLLFLVKYYIKKYL